MLQVKHASIYAILLTLSPHVFAADSKVSHQTINLHGQINSAPQVCKDNAFVANYKKDNTTASKSELTRIDLKTLTTEVLFTASNIDHTACDSVTGNYLFSANSKVYAYSGSALNHVLWIYDVKSNYIDDIIVSKNQNIVLIAEESSGYKPTKLHAIDKSTGKLLWLVTLEMYAEVTVQDDTIYLSDYDSLNESAGKIQALDIHTGAVKWRYRGFRQFHYFKPQLDKSTNTLLTGYSYENLADRDSQVIGLDPATGQEKWQIRDGYPLQLSRLPQSTNQFAYSSFVHGYIRLAWMQLPHSTAKPSLIRKWQGSVTSSLEPDGLVHTDNMTVMSLHDRTWLISKFFVFDKNGAKRDEITHSKLGKSFMAEQTWNNAVLYTNEGGLFGMIKL